MTDSLPRAYATLGLARTASQREARRRFRKLVKQWHPDRFANDPRGQAEAAERMRQINAAYDRIQAEWRSPVPPQEPPASAREARERTTPRLRREAVDEIVRALGTDGPVDVFLKSVDSWWWWPLVVAVLIQPSRAQWLQEEVAGRPHQSLALLQLFLVALAAFLRVRKWLRDRESERMR